MRPDSSGPRKAAVLGSPIAHSRSPQLHLAAYRALGLDDWTYERIECTADQLPILVGDFGPEWVGVSVTMPGKFAALQFADERTTRAELVGSANTLVRSPAGWRADNTDVDGVTGALGQVSGRADGAGFGRHSARGGRWSGRTWGAQQITVVARNADKAAPLVDLAARSVPRAGGVRSEAQIWRHASPTWTWWSTPFPPTPWQPTHIDSWRRTPVLLDAIYDPWPTPLAVAVNAAGGRVISGLQMLLNQAFAQVEQFTGLPAPREAMRAALDGH